MPEGWCVNAWLRRRETQGPSYKHAVLATRRTNSVCLMKKIITCMAFPLRRGSKTTKDGIASSWREKKYNNTIHDSGESFQSCVGYWNSIERISYVFMPHFWDPSFELTFKMLIYA